MSAVCVVVALQSPIQHVNKQKGLNKELSVPEFNDTHQRKRALKQTQSHPAKSGSPQAGGKAGKASGNESTDSSSTTGKHARTKSIPTSIHNQTQHSNSSSSSKDNGTTMSSLSSPPAAGAHLSKGGGDNKSSPKPKRGFFEGMKSKLGGKRHGSGSHESKSSSHLSVSNHQGSSPAAGTSALSSHLIVKSSSHIPTATAAHAPAPSSYASDAASPRDVTSLSSGGGRKASQGDDVS